MTLVNNCLRTELHMTWQLSMWDSTAGEKFLCHRTLSRIAHSGQATLTQKAKFPLTQSGIHKTLLKVLGCSTTTSSNRSIGMRCRRLPTSDTDPEQPPGRPRDRESTGFHKGSPRPPAAPVDDENFSRAAPRHRRRNTPTNN